MKSRSQKRQMVIIFIVCVCTLLVQIISSAVVIDRDTIEFAYLFDEGKGDIAEDLSENGRDGEITGAKYVDGVFGKCLQYDGVDDNLIVPDFTGVNGLQPRTTVFWFKSEGTRDHSWVKWGANRAGEKYYIRAHPRGGGCNLRIEVSGGQNFGADNVCDGEWHHCAVVFPEGSDSVKDHDLYVDGILQTKEGNDQEMNTDGNTVLVNIGARLTGHTFLLGLLDEVAIFNTDLSLEQIDTIMNNGLEGALGVDPQGKLATNWARIKTN